MFTLMNGLLLHHYRIWLMRLVGSMVLVAGFLCMVKTLRALHEINFKASAMVMAGPECHVGVLEDVPLRPCAARGSAPLPLLWSIGHKKPLRAVTFEDLLWISGIGPSLGRRVLRHRQSKTWSELAAKTKLSSEKINQIKAYLQL